MSTPIEPQDPHGSMIESILSQGWDAAKDDVCALPEDARRELLRRMTCMFLDEADPECARAIALVKGIVLLVPMLPHDRVWFAALTAGEGRFSEDAMFERCPGLWALGRACAAGDIDNKKAIVMHRHVVHVLHPLLWDDEK